MATMADCRKCNEMHCHYPEGPCIKEIERARERRSQEYWTVGAYGRTWKNRRTDGDRDPDRGFGGC
jgi:hypothetical protein